MLTGAAVRRLGTCTTKRSKCSVPDRAAPRQMCSGSGDTHPMANAVDISADSLAPAPFAAALEGLLRLSKPPGLHHFARWVLATARFAALTPIHGASAGIGFQALVTGTKGRGSDAA